MSVEVVTRALKGSDTAISGYMISPANDSHVFAFDLDSDSGMEQAQAIQKVMARINLPAYVETSRRGAHLWCVMDAVLPAASVRNAMRIILGYANLPTGDPRIEMRPGSDAINEGGLGHALRMPLMVHPKTGQRSVIYDPDGCKLAKVGELMLALDYAPAKEVARLGRLWHPPVTRIPPEMRNPHRVREDDGETASGILQERWGVVARPGDRREVRCPLHNDKSASLFVMEDDKRVICHSTACILHNDGRGRGTWELRHLEDV